MTYCKKPILASSFLVYYIPKSWQTSTTRSWISNLHNFELLADNKTWPFYILKLRRLGEGSDGGKTRSQQSCFAKGDKNYRRVLAYSAQHGAQYTGEVLCSFLGPCGTYWRVLVLGVEVVLAQQYNNLTTNPTEWWKDNFATKSGLLRITLNV